MKRTCFTLLIFTTIFSAVTYGQDCLANAKIESPLSNVSLSRLCQRLDFYYEVGADPDFGKTYDVLLEKPAEGREKYIEQRKKERDVGRSVDFAAFSLTGGYDESPQYWVMSCITVSERHPGRSYTYTDIVIAHWVNGDWYFSNFGEPAENERCHRPIS